MKLSALVLAVLGVPIFLALTAVLYWRLQSLGLSPVFVPMMMAETLASPIVALLPILMLCELLLKPPFEGEHWLKRQMIQSGGQTNWSSNLITRNSALLLAPSLAILLLAAAAPINQAPALQWAWQLHLAALLPMAMLFIGNSFRQPRTFWMALPGTIEGWRFARFWQAGFIILLLAFYFGLLDIRWLTLFLLIALHVVHFGSVRPATTAGYIELLVLAACYAGAVLILFLVSSITAGLFPNPHLTGAASAVLIGVFVALPLTLGGWLKPLAIVALLAPWLPLVARVSDSNYEGLAIALVLLLGLGQHWRGWRGHAEDRVGAVMLVTMIVLAMGYARLVAVGD